jgi:hypothetical protein
MMSAELSEAADKPRLVHSSEWQEPQLTSLRIDDGDTPHEFHLAVACMTKHPSNFPTWLLYHRRMVGVEHFFLRVEDTPVLEKFLSTEPWSTFVTVDSAHSTVRDWEGQTNRQCEHVRRSIKAARNAGITHLLHIDDDELLYLPHGFNLLRATILRAPAETADFHCLNLEAMAPSIDCVNPFVECTAFRHCSSDYCAYGGGLRSKGKSIGVVGRRPYGRSGRTTLSPTLKGRPRMMTKTAAKTGHPAKFCLARSQSFSTTSPAASHAGATSSVTMTGGLDQRASWRSRAPPASRASTESRLPLACKW